MDTARGRVQKRGLTSLIRPDTSEVLVEITGEGGSKSVRVRVDLSEALTVRGPVLLGMRRRLETPGSVPVRTSGQCRYRCRPGRILVGCVVTRCGDWHGMACGTMAGWRYRGCSADARARM